jgi:hypothetical protein
VLGDGADNQHDTLALDNFAFLAARLYGSPYLHVSKQPRLLYGNNGSHTIPARMNNPVGRPEPLSRRPVKGESYFPAACANQADTLVGFP